MVKTNESVPCRNTYEKYMSKRICRFLTNWQNIYQLHYIGLLLVKPKAKFFATKSVGFYQKTQLPLIFGCCCFCMKPAANHPLFR